MQKKHKKLLNFLTGGEDVLDEDELINLKLENLEKLKFDDEKWQIDPVRFIIHGWYNPK
jgi:hypothetical protein